MWGGGPHIWTLETLGDCRQAFRGPHRLLRGARAHHLINAAPPLCLPSFLGLSRPRSSRLLALSLHQSCWSTEQGQKLPTGQGLGQFPFIPALAPDSSRQKQPLPAAAEALPCSEGEVALCQASRESRWLCLCLKTARLVKHFLSVV